MTVSSRNPIARLDDLVVTGSGDSLLAYDQTTHSIHHLNGTSAAIWKLCDGRHDTHAIGLQAGLATSDVRDHLDLLAEINLLVEGTWSITTGTTSRRRFLKKTAIAGAVVAPVVVSMTAPNAAGAVSELCSAPCVIDQDCPSGCICGPGGQCSPDAP